MNCFTLNSESRQQASDALGTLGEAAADASRVGAHARDAAGIVAERVLAAREAVRDLDARESRVRAMLEAPISPLRQQVEQIGAWMSGALQQAHEAIRRLEAAGRAAQK